MIDRIRIREFKSLNDVTLDLNPLTVIIGRSGTGKSNLVDAVRFLRDYLVAGNIDRYFGQGRTRNLYEIIPAGRTEATLLFEITFSVKGEPRKFVYSLMLGLVPKNDANARLLVEQLDLGERTIFKQQQQALNAMKGSPFSWVVEPSISPPAIPGSLVLGRLFGIPEIKLAHLALTSGLGCYDFPGGVLGEPAAQKGGMGGLEDNASNYFGVMETIASDLSNLSSFREIIGSMRKLVPSVRSLDIDTRSNNVLVSFEASQDRRLALPLSHQSEGFRRFLAHLLALEQIPSKLTAFFEEPEKGIYPGALAVLADHFRASSERERTQCILTTQSPELLGHFPVESLRVVTMQNYQTHVGPIAADQVQAVHDSLLTTSELLTVDEAHAAQPA